MAVKSRQDLYFQRIRLQNWKNFSSIDVPLQRRIFLVGPNAAGKSNFLDAIRFLHDIVAVGGGLQAAIEKRGGIKKVRSLFARRNSDIVIEVSLSETRKANDSAWEYELVLNTDKKDRVCIKRERIVKPGQVLVERPNKEDKDDPEQLTETYLEQTRANREFREMVEFFASMRYLHIVPHLVREPDRSKGRKNDPYGGDFLEQLATTTEKTRMNRLKKIEAALRNAIPQISELTLARDERGTPHLKGKYQHWRPQGAWQNEEQFSDGTLRLLGLLWALLDGDGPLLLEEPELSLHPGVVQYLPQMLARLQQRSKRQVILSSHSSDLLRDDGIGLDEALVLTPGPQGTTVQPASDFEQVKRLLDGGLTLADALLPQTNPKDAQQLTLFDNE